MTSLWMSWVAVVAVWSGWCTLHLPCLQCSPLLQSSLLCLGRFWGKCLAQGTLINHLSTLWMCSGGKTSQYVHNDHSGGGGAKWWVGLILLNTRLRVPPSLPPDFLSGFTPLAFGFPEPPTRQWGQAQVVPFTRVANWENSLTRPPGQLLLEIYLPVTDFTRQPGQ